MRRAFHGGVAAALLLFPVASFAQQSFDSHVHLWNGAESVADYEAQLARDGQEVSGFGAMWFGGPNQALAGDPEAIRRGNDGLIALARAHPAIVPIATVHPYDGDAALAELERVAGLGVRVLKIHPHTQKFDPADPRVLALVRKAGALKLVVVMDNAHIVPGGDSEKLFNLALQAPQTKFVFAHMGGTNFRFWNILKMARTAEGLFGNNIYFDISAIVTLVADSPLAEEFVWTIRNVGIDHVLLGSDYPQFSLAQTVEALDKLGLTAEERAKILSENGRRLFMSDQ
ncbi:amidohydrolase family protein [Sphingopyxis sp. MWB1]|uniref:amidohydrolase family protein n=1 Tax=Sphingopyxis sp. MWB1 TaxID=1537715 RepID=UPI0009DE41AE|nr:amidohydrolase family protein [Sphingopyxis sp. MWB1]